MQGSRKTGLEPRLASVASNNAGLFGMAAGTCSPLQQAGERAPGLCLQCLEPGARRARKFSRLADWPIGPSRRPGRWVGVMKRRGQSKKEPGGVAWMGSPGFPWVPVGRRKKKEEILETEETGRVLITPASGPGITDRPAVSMQFGDRSCFELGRQTREGEGMEREIRRQRERARCQARALSLWRLGRAVVVLGSHENAPAIGRACARLADSTVNVQKLASRPPCMLHSGTAHDAVRCSEAESSSFPTQRDIAL